ncbi:MAG: hypothetical protein SYR96_40310, partial [Actinomycetota bacterium]|nr:hypothetical protein [Actinomycetota bacterium]
FTNSVINFYGKIGDVYNAVNTFNNIPIYKKNIVTISAMMNCFIDNNQNEKAISLYEEYNGKHNDITNSLFIKACTNIGDADKGIKLIKSTTKIMDSSITFINTVIDFYGKIGDVNNAVNTFNIIPENRKNIVTINAMMNCFIDNNQNEKAISLYEQYNHYTHDDVSNLLFIKACTNIGDVDKGTKVIKSTTNGGIKFIASKIDFYGKIGDVNNAVNTFNNIPENKKNIVTIGAMMKCFIDNNQNEKAISIYEQYNHYKHDDISNTLFIKACTNIGDADKGIKLIKSTTNDSIEFTNSVINFYGKIGDVNNAVNTFDNISKKSRNIVDIGAMMKCFIDNNQNEKAISLYEQYNGQHNHVSNLLFI